MVAEHGALTDRELTFFANRARENPQAAALHAAITEALEAKDRAG